jgi:hypothetical protein
MQVVVGTDNVVVARIDKLVQINCGGSCMILKKTFISLSVIIHIVKIGNLYILFILIWLTGLWHSYHISSFRYIMWVSCDVCWGHVTNCFKPDRRIFAHVYWLYYSILKKRFPWSNRGEGKARLKWRQKGASLDRWYYWFQCGGCLWWPKV